MRTALCAVRAALLFMTCAISPGALAQQAAWDPLAPGAARPLNGDERAERRARPAVERCLSAVRVSESGARRRAVIELRVGAGRAAVTAIRVEVVRRPQPCAGTEEACRNSGSPPVERRSPAASACVTRAVLSAAAAIKRGPVRELTWTFTR